MNNFNEIKDIWDSQISQEQIVVPQALLKRINKSNRFINNKHILTIIILTISAIAVGFGFGYLLKIQSLIGNLGLIIMEMVLCIRIVIEFYSYKRKQLLDVSEYTNSLVLKLKDYYQWRKSLHGIKTLLLVMAYILGVALMFVEFKSSLSIFWFNFFAIEFIVLSAVLIFYIRKHIKKEIKEMEELIFIYTQI